MDESKGRFDRYEILEELSRGSMGIVYRAFDPILQRDVAIKVLAQGRVSNKDDVARFMREARSVARLSHPNIVPVHEVGEHAGNPYFTMDFIHGQVLSQMLKSTGALPPRKAVQIVREVAKALVVAHEKGLIHRDIKPSNVMMANDGRVLLMDFGLAKDMSSDTVRTQSGTTIGTPAYMPPEQARGNTAEISDRSDVYSLGAVLFECLTGRPPFEGEGMVEVVMHVLEDPPPAPRKLNPKIPRDLETVVLRCLEKSPQHRYASMAGLERDLGHYLDGEAIEAHRPGLLRRVGRRIYRHGKLLAGLATGAIGATALIIILAAYGTPLRPEKSESLAWSAPLTVAAAGTPEANLWRTNTGYLDYDPVGGTLKARLVGKEMVTQEILYGNLRAKLKFVAGSGKGSLGMRLWGQEGVVLLATLGEDGILRLVGPTELENYQVKRPFENTRLLAAAEGGTLTVGETYTFELARVDLGVTVTLWAGEVQSPEDEPLAEIDYKGLQLSNWRMKNEQIGVLGVDERISSGELSIWLEIPGYHSPLVGADDRFYHGEYNGAKSAYDAILADKGLPVDVQVKAALHLAYYHEIKSEYDEALPLLGQVVSQSTGDETMSDIQDSAKLRRLVVLTKKKSWAEANGALADLPDIEFSAWRWELLPEAERMLAGGQSEAAAKLFVMSGRVFPAAAIADRLSAAGKQLIGAGELAYAVLLLADVRFPGRYSALETLVKKSREQGNRPALMKACGLLAGEAAGEKRDAVVGILAAALLDASAEDAAFAKELVAHFGATRAEVMTQALWRAVKDGRFREFGIMLSLGGAAPLPGKSLNETAAILMEKRRFDDVLKLYTGSPSEDLLGPALSAAEQLVSQEKVDDVAEFLSSLASRGHVDEKEMTLAESVVRIELKRTPLAGIVTAYVRGPFFRAKSLAGIVDTLLSSTEPAGRPAMLMDLWEKLLAEDVGEVYDGLVEASAAALEKVGEVQLPWRDPATFDILASGLTIAAGSHPAPLLALADIMCLMDHPEKAVLVWDRVAFQNVGASRKQVGQAAFKEGLYFLLNGDSKQAESFMKLASFSGWKYPQTGGIALKQLIDAFTAGKRETIVKAYSDALTALPPGGLISLLEYYHPLWLAAPAGHTEPAVTAPETTPADRTEPSGKDGGDG
jgi:hypothetical protein